MCVLSRLWNRLQDLKHQQTKKNILIIIIINSSSGSRKIQKKKINVFLRKKSWWCHALNEKKSTILPFLCIISISSSKNLKKNLMYFSEKEVGGIIPLCQY